jgi:uncharacterized protein Yka (UPF0111/DUF47 family)
MFFGKNREFIDEVHRFVEICGVGVEDFINTFHYYISNGIDGEFLYGVEKVKKLESDADEQLNKIRTLLYGKFLLPEAREDIAILMGRFDDIIDDAMHTLKFIQTRNLKPIKCEEIKKQYVVLLNGVSDCFDKCAKATKMVFGASNDEEIKRLAEDVGRYESLCDDAEDEIIQMIFSNEHATLEKILQTELAERCSSIADSCEHAVSAVNIINLKRVL